MRRSAIPALALMTSLAGVAASEPPAFVTVRQADRLASAWEIPAASLSADGRYVAFASYAHLSPTDTNTRDDIYVLDRVRGEVTLETGPVDEDAPDRDCLTPRISGDGRFLVYETVRSGLDRSSAVRVIELRDRSRGTTRVIQGRDLPNGGCRLPTISRDGRVVAFTSAATNLTDEGDANDSGEDVYTFDTASGRISRVSLDSAGRQPPHGTSFAPSVSADGRFVAFTSTSAFDSPTPSKSKFANIYVRDINLGTTRRVSVCRRSTEPNSNSYDAAISDDGRYVVFTSDASNLLPGDTNGVSDVFLRDVQAGKTTLVSRGIAGASANGPSGRAAISASGEVVVFQSDASDLICGSRCPASAKDINLVSDVFVLSVAQQKTSCLSTGRSRWMEPSGAPAVDGAGDVIVFSSRHPIDAQDSGNDFDLFVRAGPR